MALVGAWHPDRVHLLDTDKQKNLLPEINYKQKKHNRINIEVVDYIISYNQRVTNLQMQWDIVLTGASVHKYLDVAFRNKQQDRKT